MTSSNLEVLHAYRHLYRTGLRAIQYSTPARYTLRDRLRLSFRSSPITDFEPARISNTLEFLQNATTTRGLEHKVLRNLLLVWYWEPQQWELRWRRMNGNLHGPGGMHGAGARGRGAMKWKGEMGAQFRAFDGFYWSLRMLNESMGLCLR